MSAPTCPASTASPRASRAGIRSGPICISGATLRSLHGARRIGATNSASGSSRPVGILPTSLTKAWIRTIRSSIRRRTLSRASTHLFSSGLCSPASLWLLEVQSDLPRAFVLTSFAWLCFAFFVQGAWLEGRPSARRLEWMRIASALALAAAAYFVWPAASGAAPGIAAYVALSAAALGISQMIASRGGALRADHSTQPT